MPMPHALGNPNGERYAPSLVFRQVSSAFLRSSLSVGWCGWCRFWDGLWRIRFGWTPASLRHVLRFEMLDLQH